MYGKNFDFKERRDHQKISYERRVYESVDDSAAYLIGYISKTDEKKELVQQRPG